LVGPACGAATRPAVPPGGPTGGLGPRVQAVAALCPGAYHLSKRTTQRVLEDLLGRPVRLGTIATLEQATGRAVADPVAAARAYVQQPSAADLDETGWREGQHCAGLWTAVTTGLTVFVVRLARGGKVAQELVGERCWGWLVTERWRAYTWDPAWRRQVGGAHRLRDIEAMSERGGPSQAMGEALRAQARPMCHAWPRGGDGTLAHARCAPYLRPIRREGERRLEAGQTCGVPTTEGVCREILKVRQAWWTFVRHAGVEPTNNAAERAIRPGVLGRKGSLGTQRADGARCVAAVMTVVATLTQQHRHVRDYLTTAGEASLRGEDAPSLLPTPPQLNQCLCPAASCDRLGERLRIKLFTGLRKASCSDLAALENFLHGPDILLLDLLMRHFGIALAGGD
jgi:transposase